MKYVKRLVAVALAMMVVCSLVLTSGLTVSALEGTGYADANKKILGCDLSYWNVDASNLNYSLVNFDKLVASGCEFAIIRIGLGSSSNTCSMDKAFKEYYSRARAAGMKLGVYFYSHALTYNQAANEAKWCINVIESNNMYFEYPIYVDMEESDQTALSSSGFTNVALGFCETMEAAGYFPGFYGMHSAQSKLTSAFTSKYDRWTAWVKSSTNSGSQYSYNSKDLSSSYGMWQFTWYGQNLFSGIGLKMLDVNVCYKDYPAIMEKYGYNNVSGGGSTADKLGTYYITASSNDPLNVRDTASTSGTKLDEVKEGDIVNVTELSGNWGKFVSPNGSTGWASIKNYSNYIGIDAQAYESGIAWGEIDKTVNDKGSMTLTNTTAEQAAYDFHLPVQIGTATTPYFAIMVTPNSGNGYYFGLTQTGSGYFMMRDCNSGDQLVNETTAPYMTGQEKLEINLKDWWKTSDYRIDSVRMYIAPQSSVTINYMYFAATANTVTSEVYNLLNETTTPINYTLMDPENIAVADATKNGGYTYTNGLLAVTSGEDSGYDVVFTVNKEINVNELTRWLISVDAQVRYDIVLTVTTSDGDRTFGVCADFWNWVCEAPDGGYIPAMTHSAGLDLKSCYTYNGILPADGMSTIKTVTVRVGGKGTVYFRAIQIANSDVLVSFEDGVSKSLTTPEETPDTNDKPETTVVAGDVNEDAFVTSADARQVLLFTVSAVVFTDSQSLAADVNGDGKISTADAREILITASNL